MSWRKIELKLWGGISSWEHMETGAVLSIYERPDDDGSYEVVESLNGGLEVIAITNTLSEASVAAESYREANQ